MTQPHITTVYRTYDGDNGKPRPAYYSKRLAFESFLLSWNRIPPSERRLIVLTNTPSVPREIVPLCDRYADDVIYWPRQGNRNTFVRSLSVVENMPRDGLAYFSEDDYLYMPDAISELRVAAATMPDVEYFTLYDHLDRYTRIDDVRFGRREFFRVSGHRHWKVVESTCNTFAGRVSVVQRDAFLHGLFARVGRTRDRTAWRLVQGIGPFFWKVPKRRLVGPIPSLATHLEPGYLAPNVDWTGLAAEVTAQAHLLHM